MYLRWHFLSDQLFLILERNLFVSQNAEQIKKTNKIIIDISCKRNKRLKTFLNKFNEIVFLISKALKISLLSIDRNSK
jgi:hypothetical protein